MGSINQLITGGHHPAMLGPISNSSITISPVTGRPLVSLIMTTPTAGRQVGGADFLSDFRGTKQNFLGTGHNQKTCRLCYNPIKRVVKLNFVHLFLFNLKIFPCTNPLKYWLHPLQRLLVKSIRFPGYIGGDVSYVCCRSLQPRNIIIKRKGGF